MGKFNSLYISKYRSFTKKDLLKRSSTNTVGSAKAIFYISTTLNNATKIFIGRDDIA